MKVVFAKSSPPAIGTLVVGALEDRQLSPTAAAIDSQTRGALVRAMAASRFKGKKDETLELLAPVGVKVGRVLLLGLGKPAALDTGRAQALGGVIVAALNRVGEAAGFVAIDVLAGTPIGAADVATEMAFGARLRAYRFDKYRTTLKEEQKPTLKTLTIMLDAAATARANFAKLDRIAESILFTRDLVSEPANVIYPETLAAAAKTLTKSGVKVEVLDDRQMKKLGMGALLGVGQGSARPSRLVVMQWNGAPGAKDKRPIAFVGKGVTFDTGGISIKPAANMEDMKWDMAGSAVVIGLIKALAERKAKANVVGVAGLVENMPSGTAQRPGDVVTTMSGKTVEVINTDAEGRLVLADAMWYCQDRFKPKAMIDLATLTGAIIIALGHEHAGLFSNNDELADRLVATSRKVGEPLWRLPLGDAYDRDIDSDIADVKNVGSGRGAGSITAAQFLQRFVNNVPWAHLDIAGVAWAKKDTALYPKGATAFGVRLLDRLVADYYENA